MLTVASCSMTSVGVIPLRGMGTGETTVILNADTEVRFWADLDGMYDYKDSAQYDVQLLQDGRIVSTAVCDPIVVHENVRVCTIVGWFGGVHKSHCRMRCRAHVPKSGPTLVRATLSTRLSAEKLHDCCEPRPFPVYSANITIQQ